jgi:hypothetical protein
MNFDNEKKQALAKIDKSKNKEMLNMLYKALKILET